MGFFSPEAFSSSRTTAGLFRRIHTLHRPTVFLKCKMSEFLYGRHARQHPQNQSTHVDWPCPSSAIPFHPHLPRHESRPHWRTCVSELPKNDKEFDIVVISVNREEQHLPLSLTAGMRNFFSECFEVKYTLSYYDDWRAAIPCAQVLKSFQDHDADKIPG